MIRLAVKVPTDIAVAVSGGCDSMSALEFLRLGGRKVEALYFDHGTPHGSDAREWIKEYCENRKIQLTVGSISSSKPRGESEEAWWRKERYSFLEEASQGREVVLGHHLDDAIENWIMTSIRGNPEVIPPRRGRFIRPLLLTRKESIKSWARSRGVPWIEDPSNAVDVHDRNFVRNSIVPQAFRLNPGLDKVVRKKIELLRGLEAADDGRKA